MASVVHFGDYQKDEKGGVRVGHEYTRSILALSYDGVALYDSAELSTKVLKLT